MLWTDPHRLRRAHAADLPAIMAIERRPGNEQLVGRYSEEQHLDHLRHPGMLYLVRDDASGKVDAFAALSGIGGADGEVRLNRLMTRAPGNGSGSVFLSAILEAVFDGTPAETIWLNVLTDNQRAIAFYRHFGFAAGPVSPRAGRRPDGVIGDLLTMRLGRDEWLATRKTA